jgi:hypothetical protein
MPFATESVRDSAYYLVEFLRAGARSDENAASHYAHPVPDVEAEPQDCGEGHFLLPADSQAGPD